MATTPSDAAPNFVRTIVEGHIKDGTYGGRVVTRFPPEPNGFPHIGHAKAICLGFGLAEDYDGQCNLRMDDTNPTTEDIKYEEAIARDIRWLGFNWGDNLFHASDYFGRLYDMAEILIKKGKAYVDSQSLDELRAGRGTVTEAGVNSPFRGRSVEENLDLFRRMKAGEFEDGAHVLRAKIDMGNPNMKMRDPLLYRIRHAHHYRTGDDWCIYPMYDFAHPLSDAIEGITHSLCSLEFENNRELYDWVVAEVGLFPTPPRQYEFARLKITYTVLSKRKLLRLVEDGIVSGWDDPRMPTLAGYRRGGCPPEAIRAFCERVGVSKANSVVDVSMLEQSIREHLNESAPRAFAVLDPLKVIVTNYPEGKVEPLTAPLFPDDRDGERTLPFTRELFIEREDFMEVPLKGFRRLAPGRELRFKYAYYLTCNEVIKDDAGNILEVHCTYDPASKGGTTPDNRKVKGTIHWLSATESPQAPVRLYDRLFADATPDGAKGGPDFMDALNPNSLKTVQGYIEPGLQALAPGGSVQFERLGYFVADAIDSAPGAPVFNRTVTLKDSWGKPSKAKTPKAAPAPKAPKVIIQAARSPLSVESQALVSAHGLSEDDARIIGEDSTLSAYFAEAIKGGGTALGVSKLLINEVLRVRKEIALVDLPFPPAHIGELAGMLEDGTLSSSLGKEVFEAMLEGAGSPEAIADARGLKQISDVGALKAIVDEVIAKNAANVQRYKEGNTRVLGFFVGQVMKATQGKADPRVVNGILKDALG